MHPFRCVCCLALLLGAAWLPAGGQDKPDATAKELARLEGK
jgi:hypothetical protein